MTKLSNQQVQAIVEAITSIVEASIRSDACCAQGKEEAYDILKEALGDPFDKSDRHGE